MKCPGCKGAFLYDPVQDIPVLDDPVSIIVEEEEALDIDVPDLTVTADMVDIIQQASSPVPTPYPAAAAGPPAPSGARAAASVVSAPTEVIIVGRRSPATPPEPWYYGYLAFLAYIDVAIGCVLCGLATLFLLALTIPVSESDSPMAAASGAGLLTGPFIIGAFVSGLGCLSAGGFLLMVIDVGRNIRGQRYKI